ncbi:MAG: hypothetical protein A2687_01205 [Candidatus Levybacteria bacterium RIFCSPHIGHO2_01_FULL_38_26]|nr:MAG: hypothetical protein A2687_01205 [Candidatus Levybacteria bacterium RIFCSPHIGHO2_01_FULL_38_26]
MGKEAYIPKRHQTFRALVEKTLTHTPLFRSEILYPERLGKAREVLQNGTGLCIVANHPSRKETVQMFQIPFGDKEFRKREIVAPVALHQKFPFMDTLSRIFAVDLKYIVTEETIKQAEKKGAHGLRKNQGVSKYINNALGVLSNGGILILFPQGTRRETLYSSENPQTIGSLMLYAKRADVRMGFLFVGVDLAEEVEDYSKTRGFNIFKKYKLTIGETLTDNEVLEKAGGNLREVDNVVYKHLEPLVSPKYAGI